MWVVKDNDPWKTKPQTLLKCSGLHLLCRRGHHRRCIYPWTIWANNCVKGSHTLGWFSHRWKLFFIFYAYHIYNSLKNSVGLYGMNTLTMRIRVPFRTHYFRAICNLTPKFCHFLQIEDFGNPHISGMEFVLKNAIVM